MDEATYAQKRQALVDKNPKIMSPQFLRGVRIAIGLFSLVMVKIVSGALPFYRNKCLYDNIQNSFQPWQRYFQQDTELIVAEIFIFILSKIMFCSLTYTNQMFIDF